MPGSQTITGTVHRLDRDVVHYVWDNSIPPRLEIDSGDTIVFQCRDAGDGFYHWESQPPDVLQRVWRRASADRTGAGARRDAGRRLAGRDSGSGAGRAWVHPVPVGSRACSRRTSPSRT